MDTAAELHSGDDHDNGRGDGASHGDGAPHGDHMGLYWKTIITLAVLTGIEFGIAALMTSHVIPFVVGVLLMLGLAAWKAVLVGKIFMHLSFDPRLLGWIAVSPVILGSPLIAFVCFDAIQGPWQV